MFDLSKTTPFNMSDYIDSADGVLGHLNVALEYGDEEFFHSLSYISKSKGMTALAKETGLSREALYRSLNGNTKPRFDTIAKVVDGLGMKFQLTPKNKNIKI
ncbi:FIG045511: hypothetical antitoxin (to FIG022160: hypothetical toxin) [uncultured Candidatus Thioglobus sp.]|nr:FIG045511: hypothetical antitoxin (to FIG022160: hypothetical toxin) [uncultured Candidatus Thioglobus sp.]